MQILLDNYISITTAFVTVIMLFIAIRQLIESRKQTKIQLNELSNKIDELESRKVIDEETSYNISYAIKKGKKIRVAYIIYPPSCMNDDTNSDIPFGIGPEILKLIEQKMGLEFEWTEQVTWDKMINGLNNNEYDILGTLIWETLERSKKAAFSTPVYFSPINIYSNTDTKRKLTFSQCREKFDNKKYRIGVIPGEISETIYSSYFPNSTPVYLKHNTKNIELANRYKSKEIDLCFLEPYIAENSGIKLFPLNKTDVEILNDDRVLLPNSFMLRKNDNGFTKRLNIVLNELIREGKINDIISRYYSDYESQYSY